MLTVLAAIAAWLTPSIATAAAGGGIAALLGGLFSPSAKVKWVLAGLGVLIVAIAAVAFTVHYERLKRDSEAYKALRGTMTSLETKYGCDQRPEHERDLAACLTARERDAADAAKARVEQLEREAAKARAAQAAAETKLVEQSDAVRQFLRDAPADDDGPLPKVLLDLWARQRNERGIK